MSPPTKYAVALFRGFQALDVFGPIDALNYMSRNQPLSLSILHTSLEPVTTLVDSTPGRIGQSVVPTHTYDTAPEDIEVLLVPGGMGTRDPENVARVRQFIKERYPKLRFLLTVCTGSAVAAQSGVLDGREATSNKRSFSWVSHHTLSCDSLSNTSTGRISRTKRQVGKGSKMGRGRQHLDIIRHFSRHRHDLRLYCQTVRARCGR